MDIPIIFSAPMVRALLDGRKTMTRRLAWLTRIDRTMPQASPWQKVRPGDRLWVREAFRVQQVNTFWDHYGERRDICIDYPAAHGMAFDHFRRWITRRPVSETVLSRKNGKDDKAVLTSPIHMPRWASRLTLTVTATKIERLQAITEAEACAEGVLYVPGHGEITLAELRSDPGYSNFLNGRMGFEALWNSLHGKGAWDANSEVIALAFAVERRNIDAKPEAA